MAKLKLRPIENEPNSKGYSVECHIMFGAYKAFVVYSCGKTFKVSKGMMDDFERISNVMNSNDFSNYLIARKGKYATLTQIVKEITQAKI